MTYQEWKECMFSLNGYKPLENQSIYKVLDKLNISRPIYIVTRGSKHTMVFPSTEDDGNVTLMYAVHLISTLQEVWDVHLDEITSEDGYNIVISFNDNGYFSF